MTNYPLVSIIVNNYNYRQFLPFAIESALNQTYERIEVLVVDDGSTDGSGELITSFAEQVIAILKPNGGQGSAFNAGLAASSGGIVIFLDADDMLLPSTATDVVAAFQSNSQAVKVQYRLETIDQHNRVLGETVPHRKQLLPNGDLRQQMLRFPDDLCWLPTSGNAFRADILHAIFPMPEAPYRICADYYLSNIPPLYGEVVSLDEVRGYYRVHSSNNHKRSSLDLTQTRQIIERTLVTHEQLKKHVDRLQIGVFPNNPADVHSVTFMANRIISQKLEPKEHPIADDNTLLLARQGATAALHRFDLPLVMRAIYVCWFICMMLAPKPLAMWLAEELLYPKDREEFFNRLRNVRRLIPT